jgi:hypothetical protein
MNPGRFKTLPSLDLSGRLPEDLPEDHGVRGRTRPAWLDSSHRRANQQLRLVLPCGVELASLEHPVSQVRLGSSGRFSDVEGKRQSCVECLDHPGGHPRGGVPIPGADATAPVQLPAATALVAHQLIDHPRRDALVLQPGREAVPKIVGLRSCRCARSVWARWVAVW